MVAWYVHVIIVLAVLTAAGILQDLSMWIGLGNIMSIKSEGDKVYIKWKLV